MYTLKPVSDRVAAMREKYRETQPEICTERYRLITDFYMENPDIIGIMKRAKNLRNICENIPVRIDDGEVIVGAQSAKYRACALYPENSVDWLIDEVNSRFISSRDIDPYILSEEDREYILSTGDFWLKECMSAKTDAYTPDGFFEHCGNGISMFWGKGQSMSPVGHFCANYNTAIKKGFGAIKAEAQGYISEIEENGIFGNDIERYNFYRAVSIVCDGMITLSRRYAKLAQEKAETETDPVRKKELETMADTLNWVMDKPCRNFHDAVQTLFMYQTCMCLDACMHGISFGRIDQYLGDFYEADIASGQITPEYAQELMDLFYLKVAEMNKPWSYGATMSNPGYNSGQLMTLGGVKSDGTDASNAVTYMMLQASGRLVLHDPPQALRIHKGTPAALWEAAIETTKISGGVPSMENDDIIIPNLLKRGMALEDARNYCLIGCVEPGGCGDDWPACGGTGTESYWNMANALWLAINDGHNPAPGLFGEPPLEKRVGLPTGYLYEMETFDEVLEAFKKQTKFFVKWHASCTNSFEYVAREVLPLPSVSATMTGCMEQGKDVMWGGAKYNSTGIAGVAIGNVADCLGIIKYMVYDKKRCTARELYDALIANWEGYEELHQIIMYEAPHYGNGDPEIDYFARWAADVFADEVNACTGPRGKYNAGLYPVTTNIIFEKMTAATPDGRYAGEPLADGISPVQQMDQNGPTAVLNSVANIDQSKYANGTLLNMKFHPSSLKGDEGVLKMTNLVKTYFDMGGMEMQTNVVSVETLRDAQKNPEDYKNLVVRVAGFSAYFVEMYIESQNDLIRRTELGM
ncbi:pyruvate formate lyase family protein [Eubacteriaceae bacterium ES3]|nr:pyruvate formate lyase family protein [Eubacteriaceae bacterium ES3]